TRRLEHLGDDLRVRLPVEADALEGGGVLHLFRERREDRPAAGAGREQDRAVDVEQDQLPLHRSSSRLTATSRSLSRAARVPGSHGSCTIPPHAIVECTSVSPSPAKATWVMRAPPSLRKNRRSPGRMASAATGAPHSTWSEESRGRVSPRARKVVCTTPEQSTPHGVTPPHWYGAPAKCSRAQRSGALPRAARLATAAGATAPSTTRPRRPSGRRTTSPSSVTPRKVQIRQMKVPHPAQG